MAYLCADSWSIHGVRCSNFITRTCVLCCSSDDIRHDPWCFTGVAIGLCEKWPTIRLAVLTHLEIAVFVTLSIPIADVTQRCTLCAEQLTSAHPLRAPHSCMFYALSCTEATILSNICLSAATWNKRNRRGGPLSYAACFKYRLLLLYCNDSFLYLQSDLMFSGRTYTLHYQKLAFQNTAGLPSADFGWRADGTKVDF